MDLVAIGFEFLLPYTEMWLENSAGITLIQEILEMLPLTTILL